MYKIDRRGGGGGMVQKSYTRKLPKEKKLFENFIGYDGRSVFIRLVSVALLSSASEMTRQWNSALSNVDIFEFEFPVFKGR